MSVITVDDVKSVASLAKIAITDTEAQQLKSELDVILDYMKQLESVDTKGLEPTYQVTGLKNITRPDKVMDYGVTTEQLLSNVSDTKEEYIKVPKVL